MGEEEKERTIQTDRKQRHTQRQKGMKTDRQAIIQADRQTDGRTDKG